MAKMKLIDAIKARFKKPEDALAALGLDAATIAMDAVAHDPGTGQFTSAGDHTNAAAEHHAKADEHRNIGANFPLSSHQAAQRDHRQAAAMHNRAAEHFGDNEYNTSKKGKKERTGWKQYAEQSTAAANKSSQAAYQSEPNREATQTKFRRLGAALRGKDQALAGDTKENANMTTSTPKKWSPTALVAMGAIQTYLAPRLAQDSAIDLKPILRDVTAKNFAQKRPLILTDIRRAVVGNLAADADIEDLGEVLDKIDELADEGREALGEARADEDNPMVDNDADLEPEDQGGPGGEGGGEGGGDKDDDNEIRSFLADKLSPEDLETVCGMMKARGAAVDETPEEKMKRERDEGKEPVMDKKAMDAAIASAISAAVSASDRRHAEVVEAGRAVRAYVGDLAMAFDSAEAVYRHALTALGVQVKGVHKDALPAILAAQPKPGARPREERIAQDAAGATSFAIMFPGAARIGHA